tara:strand:+ start:360 stop:1331 length:972 start_codon:yes stop_codon:yes gene_type:complete
MATYTYPLERQDDYKGRITFRPIVYSPPEVNTSGLGGFFRRGSGEGLASRFTETGAFEAIQTAEPFGGRGPDIDIEPVGDQIVQASNEFTDRSKGVILYLPTAFIVNDQMNYEQLNLGPIGATAEAGMKAGQGAMGALARGAGQAASSMVGLLTGSVTDQRAARLAAVRLAQAAPIGETGANAVGSALGVAVNPNTRALFRSVGLREFSFSFQLIASSANEADEIERIVKFFREEMYPDTINIPGGLNVPVGYEFPNKFEIVIDYNNTQVGTRILPSFLRSAQVTYNPNNMGYHRDGKPSEVSMTLSFGESKTLTKQDIRDGY